LRNKQHCILNKQYSKEEYEALAPKIIQHMNDMPYTDKKGRVYKYGEFFPTELAFYRRMNLPLPRTCPNCRHYQRLKQCNPLRLWTRQCMAEGCPNTFQTSYAPDRPEIVYREACYLKEVI